MNIKYLFTLLINLHLLIAQILPFESTEIKSDQLSFSEKRLDLDCELNGIISINRNDFNIIESGKYLYMELLIELIETKTIKLELLINDLNKESKFFLIDLDDNDIIGPFYKNQTNSMITLGPIEASRFVLQGIIPIEDLSPSNITILSVQDIKANKKSLDQRFYKKITTRDNPVIVVTGFWPPTNEMVRQFSQDDLLNPNGWQGENWNGLGYDIVSFFPEFDNPDCSSCGQGYGDFEVDYQDTSLDFWNLIDNINPIAIITFSRGFMDNSWELEYNFYNRTNWINDYIAPLSPTPNPPDENEDSFFLRHSTLPMESIVNTINSSNLNLNSYIDWDGDPGRFVSEFMGYHGVWYHDLNQFSEEPCFFAGHVHVGGLIDWEIATQAAEYTIIDVIDALESFVYTLGDVNADYNIDILDLVIIVSHILGTDNLSGASYYAADMNSNGIINIQDIILLINIILS